MPRTTMILAPATPRLTREQTAKVRSMVEDEGCTRTEATAWVRAFEPANDRAARSYDADAVLATLLPGDLRAAGAT